MKTMTNYGKSIALTFLISILSTSSSPLVKDVEVHMTNELGEGTTLKLRCASTNNKDLGQQELVNGVTCQWKFSIRESPSVHLRCNVSLDGARDFEFVAYNEDMDTCRTDCDWLFSKVGVFAFRGGVWRFRYTWPH